MAVPHREFLFFDPLSAQAAAAAIPLPNDNNRVVGSKIVSASASIKPTTAAVSVHPDVASEHYVIRVPDSEASQRSTLSGLAVAERTFGVRKTLVGAGQSNMNNLGPGLFEGDLVGGSIVPSSTVDWPNMFSNVSVPGTALSTWEQGGNHYIRLVAILEQVPAGDVIVLFQQGERDAQDDLLANTWGARFDAMVLALRAEPALSHLNIGFLLGELSESLTTDAPYLETAAQTIRDSIRDAPNRNPGLVWTVNFDDLLLVDGIHYSSTDAPVRRSRYENEAALRTPGVSQPENAVAPIITAPTSPVTIDDAITVQNNGSWTNSPTHFLYQWQADFVTGFEDVSGETANSLLAGASLSAADIRLQVRGVNAGGPSVYEATSNVLTVEAGDWRDTFPTLVGDWQVGLGHSTAGGGEFVWTDQISGWTAPAPTSGQNPSYSGTPGDGLVFQSSTSDSLEASVADLFNRFEGVLSWTVVARIEFASVSSTQAVFGAVGDSDNKVTGRVTGGAAVNLTRVAASVTGSTNGGTVSALQKHTIGWSYDGAAQEMRVYMNGALVSTNPNVDDVMADVMQAFTISGFSNNGPDRIQQMNAELFEFMVFASALSNNDHMNAHTKLVGDWP